MSALPTKYSYVEAIKEKHEIVYCAVPDKGHCDLTDEMRDLYNEHIIKSITK